MPALPKASPPPGDLGFLSLDPEPVGSQAQPTAEDVLPQPVADQLLRLPGVDGAWIERDAQGRRVVVLYYSRPGQPTHLPGEVEGMPTRIIGGEPIRAGG
ncbi:MAG: hypothetical protein ACK4R2_06515 [Roseateles sp.]